MSEYFFLRNSIELPTWHTLILFTITFAAYNIFWAVMGIPFGLMFAFIEAWFKR